MITLIHSETPGKIITYPPLGIAYLCGDLKRRGISSIHVIDLSAGDTVDWNSLKKSKLIGISSVSLGFSKVKRLIKQIKGCTDKPIVLGGAHASMVGSSLLKEIPELDYLIMGEGEDSLIHLLEGMNVQEIKGLVYREDGNIIENEIGLLGNLDNIALPSYDYFNVGRYALFPERMMISTSRGCPFRCIYCGIHKIMGKKYRFKSPLRVVDEIDFFVKKYGTKFFDIVDDNFTAKKQRVHEICDLILERGLKISIAVGSGVRVDGIDKDLLKKMKEAGLVKLSFGIESTDKEVLKAIKKGVESVEHITEVCRYAREIGISTKGFFIIGSPQDSFLKVKKSMEFAKTLELSAIVVSMVTPLPGTELWDWTREKAKSLIDPVEYLNYHTLQPDQNVVPFETDDFTKEERIKAWKYASKIRRQIGGGRKKRICSILKKALGKKSFLSGNRILGLLTYCNYLIEKA